MSQLRSTHNSTSKSHHQWLPSTSVQLEETTHASVSADRETTVLYDNAGQISTATPAPDPGQQQSATDMNKVDGNASSGSERRCWICFDEDDGDDNNCQDVWVKPCPCSLVSHEQCLLDWITESQKDAPAKKVHCPQCGTPYVVSGSTSLTLVVLTLLDKLAHAAAPYITLLGLGCSVFITSTTYGAYTVMALLGPEQGEQLIGTPAQWSWRVWSSLPFIPVILVSSRFRWADGLLPFAAVFLLRAAGHPMHQLKLSWPLSPATVLGLFPWIRLLYNNLYVIVQHQLSRKILLRRGYSRNRNLQQDTQQNHQELLADNDDQQKSSGGLSVISALLWPVISTLLGSCLNHFKLVRQYFPEPFHRNVLGGCLYILAKDMAGLVYRYEKIRQRQSRRVKNHDEVVRR